MAKLSVVVLTTSMLVSSQAIAQSWKPPALSRPLLAGAGLDGAYAVDEAYRAQFTICDGLAPGGQGKNTFLGYRVPRACTSDPSRVRALLKLPNGGVLWESKMALDVDGSFAATSGHDWRNGRGQIRRTTDQCGTTFKWTSPSHSTECAHPEEQVDPDLFPYAVIPAGAATFVPKAQRQAAIRQFRNKTGLRPGDLGIIIYRDRWTPAFIADTGPIFRLGEGSSGAFRALGESRCRVGALDTHGRCVGDGSNRYPYTDAGIESGVIFIFFPGSGAGLTKTNAIARMCDLARTKLGLQGASVCGSQ